MNPRFNVRLFKTISGFIMAVFYKSSIVMFNHQKLYPVAFILAMSVLLTACGRGGIDDYKAPESSTAEQIFAETCSNCHGNDGSDKLFGMMFALNPGDKSIEELSKTILTGRNGMPAFANLSSSQRMALASYIKELRKE